MIATSREYLVYRSYYHTSYYLVYTSHTRKDMAARRFRTYGGGGGGGGSHTRLRLVGDEF